MMEIWKQAKELLAPTRIRNRKKHWAFECKTCGLIATLPTQQEAEAEAAYHSDCSCQEGDVRIFHI
jgi:hypothetical protein